MSADTSQGQTPTADFKKSRESFSQFAARVLDQLSISAWLPAATLVFGILVIGELQRTGNISEAMSVIASMGWGAIVLSLGAVVLATMATQAFGFGAIRILEGYWGARRSALMLTDVGCWFQIRRRNRYFKAVRRTRIKAAEKVLVKLVRTDLPPNVSKAIVAKPLNLRVPLDPEEQAMARKYTWQQFADARQLRRLDILAKRARQYPESDERVLPTRLGNLLRATESRLRRDPQERLEGWVLKRFHLLPTFLQIQHDEHRTRLDLYATMIFVSSALGLVGSAVLFGSEQGDLAIQVAAVCLLAVWLSYRALLASARAYASALQTIIEWLLDNPDGLIQPTPTLTPPNAQPS